MQENETHDETADNLDSVAQKAYNNAEENITSKTIYAYCVSGVDINTQTPLQTITYTYGDTNWKDKLTAYNGKTITYDAIGNPLTYDGKSFSWLGRRLMTYNSGSAVTNYTYNADGIRTTKTVGGTKTEFFLNGSTCHSSVLFLE